MQGTDGPRVICFPTRAIGHVSHHSRAGYSPPGRDRLCHGPPTVAPSLISARALIRPLAVCGGGGARRARDARAWPWLGAACAAERGRARGPGRAAGANRTRHAGPGAGARPETCPLQPGTRASAQQCPGATQARRGVSVRCALPAGLTGLVFFCRRASALTTPTSPTMKQDLPVVLEHAKRGLLSIDEGRLDVLQLSSDGNRESLLRTSS